MHPVQLVIVKVGVTGATGFIGGALVPRLAEVGYDLVLVDNRTGPLQIEPAKWPVANEDFSSDRGLKLLSDCQLIVHLAAVSGVMACAENPVASSKVNVEGTQRLVTMCTANQIPLAFASSFAVVGHPERLPITEGTPRRPSHEYGRQKAEGERTVAHLSETRSAPSAIVRMSNVYGPYRADDRLADKANVISMFLRQSLTGRILVNAPGTQRRDFVHIDDVVAHWAAIVRFLHENPEPSAHVFNCASGESYSILELAELVARLWKETRPGAGELTIQVAPNPRASVEILDPDCSIGRDLTDRLLGVTCRRRVEETVRQLLTPSSLAPATE